MPGAKCCITGCSSTYYTNQAGNIIKNNISFHRFPKSDDVKNKWISNIKLFNKQNVILRSDTRICGNHFNEFKDPVYFPVMTSPRSTQQLEYLIDEFETANIKNNDPDIDIKKTKANTLRYPGDIKTNSVPIDILKRALQQKQNQINQLKLENQRLKKEAETFEYKLKMVHKVLDSLVIKKYLGSEMVNMIKKMIDNPKLVDYLSDSRKKLPPPLFQKIQSNLGEYSDEVKKFALTLSFYSRRAYNFVRHAFNNTLPHIRTISRWHEKVDGSPGFTLSSIPIIKKKIEEAAAKGKKLKFSLQVDGMHLRSKYTVDKKGKTDGTEDFGNLKVPSKEKHIAPKQSKESTVDEDNFDPTSVVKESLTFLINCVNERWKMPVAYFFIHKLNTSDQAFLIEEVVYFLESNHIDILSVTFDGTKTNLSTARKLGASLNIDDLKPYFYSFYGTKIYIILDICHMIKLIRNNFWGRKQLINGSGKKIYWSYIPTLHNIQQKEKLHLGNRITKRHIHFTKSKMKVNLAVQVLSHSVAASLRYLSTDGNYKSKFKNVAPTADFIETMNNLFDIFNSRRMNGKIFGQALKPENIEYLSQYLDHCATYIKGLQVKTRPSRKRKSRKIKNKQTNVYVEESFSDNEQEIPYLDVGRTGEDVDPLAILEGIDTVNGPIEEFLTEDDSNWEDFYEDAKLQPGYERALESNVHTGFLGFLVAIESFKRLYEDQVIKQKNLDYIYTYKFSQDHLETFFSSVRARGGFNDNPSPSQFRDAYRKLIMDKGVRVSNGNCKLEEIICRDIFNDLDDVGVRDFINDENELSNLSELDLPQNFEFSAYKSNVLSYIAGFIKMKLIKKLECSSCLQYLNEDEVEDKLQQLKGWGKLTKPNVNLIKMCKIGESVFNQINRFDHNDIKTFSSRCLRSINLSSFCTLPSCNVVDRLDDHNFFFVKTVFECFLKIRLNHAAKLDTLNASKDFIRSQCKKLPLFNNQ